MPLHRHDRHLRPLPPGPSPRLRRRTATSFARSVLVVPPDFDGFLRRALVRRPRLSTACRFVAPCSRSWGSPGFHAPVRLLAACGRGRSAFRSTFPLAKTLRSFLLSGSRPARHRGLLPKKESLSRECPRSPRGWALPPLDRRRPVRVATDSNAASPTSGLCSTEESVAVAWTFPSRPGSMLPWALDRYVRMPAAPPFWRLSAGPLFIGPFHLDGSHPSSASVATREWRGRQVLGLSGSGEADAGANPKAGDPPVRPAGSPKTAALPIRPVTPFPGDQDRSLASSYPKADESRVGTYSEESSATPGEIPRESPATGPFHPKVLGLRHIAPCSEESVATQCSAPKSRHR
jgi:hypothetical protein